MTTASHSPFANSGLSFAHFAIFVLATAVLMALLGPFGTMLTMHWPQRFAHWIVSGCAIGAVTASALAGVCVLRRGAPTPLWMTACVAAAAAIPGGFIIEACLRVWSPDSLQHVGILQLIGQCLLLNTTLTLLAAGLFRQHAPAVAPATPQIQEDAVAPLLERLPRAFRSAQLYAILAEDHYLRVHTDRGDTLIHMRMSDAEALLKNADGLRVHRSCWVARKALSDVKRRKGQITLILVNGMETTVSRARQDNVKRAGWLDA